MFVVTISGFILAVCNVVMDAIVAFEIYVASMLVSSLCVNTFCCFIVCCYICAFLL